VGRYTEIQKSQCRQRYSPELIEAIRRLSPIERAVGEDIELRRSGFHLVALCPFHAEQTPSFYVHPGKVVFFCQGCGIGGNVFRFVQLLLNYSFLQSVEHLAARVGISVEGFQPSPELRARVTKLTVQREEEQRFQISCNERIDAVNTKYRALSRAANNAERCLREGGLCPEEQEFAWAALERYRVFEARVEREGLCDMEIMRREWLARKGEGHRNAAA
jgi:DNA primase